MSDETKDAIKDSVRDGIRRASGDQGSVDEHSIPDRILGDQYTKSQDAAARQHRGLRFTKIEPRGAGQ